RLQRRDAWSAGLRVAFYVPAATAAPRPAAPATAPLSAPAALSPIPSVTPLPTRPAVTAGHERRQSGGSGWRYRARQTNRRLQCSPVVVVGGYQPSLQLVPCKACWT